MKNVRLFYEKTGRLRFISHLDMTRFMTRALRKAGLPVWYTEGFHPHLYITFALPLSLGFESKYETCDIKLCDDGFDLDNAVLKLNSVCPEGIRFFAAGEPVMKPKEIGFAKYDILFEDGGSLSARLSDFLKSGEIVCEKRTKKGDIKKIDIAPDIVKAEVNAESSTHLSVVLPAGNEKNINPELLINAFFESCNESVCYTVSRTEILNKNGELFK